MRPLLALLLSLGLLLPSVAYSADEAEAPKTEQGEPQEDADEEPECD